MSYLPRTSSKLNRTAKKLPKELKAVLDDQIRSICENPNLGKMKKGDLANVRVHTFGFFGQLYLVAYEVDQANKDILVHAFGGHENFYRDLKQYLKS